MTRLEIVLSFISDNLWQLIVLVFIFVCRKALSDLLRRLTALTFKHGTSTLEVQAVPATAEETAHEDMKEPLNSPPDEIEQEPEDKKPSGNPKNWFSDMIHAFQEDQPDKADELFSNYVTSEQNPETKTINTACFQYFKFSHNNDSKLLDTMKAFADNASAEDTKYRVLIWLSFAYAESSGPKKEIALWKSYEKSFRSSYYRSQCTIKRSAALSQDGQHDLARQLITTALKEERNNNEISDLFRALSKVEKDAGNSRQESYCRDKSLQYDSKNRDELFSAAYHASENDLPELAICSYEAHRTLASDNATTLNNMGVLAQEMQCPTVSVNYYKEAKERGNTLAAANEGYLLLNAGFHDEAKAIARKALEGDEPHDNIYSLLGSLNDVRKKHQGEWDKLVSDAKSRQSMLREYTHAYYIGCRSSFEKRWELQIPGDLQFSIDGDKISMSWSEKNAGIGLRLAVYTMTITGHITNASFDGQYERSADTSSKAKLTASLLGTGNRKEPCFGYVSKDGRTLLVRSKTFQNSFALKFRLAE